MSKDWTPYLPLIGAFKHEGPLILKCIIGAQIDECIVEVQWFADRLGGEVLFDFKGAKILVRRDTNLQALRRDFTRLMQGYITDTIGPYPKEELTLEEQANDDVIEKRNMDSLPSRRW